MYYYPMYTLENGNWSGSEYYQTWKGVMVSYLNKVLGTKRDYLYRLPELHTCDAHARKLVSGALEENFDHLFFFFPKL